MWELGRFALRLGFCLSTYALIIDLLGSWRKRAELLRSARNATVGCLLCLTVAAVTLWVLLVRSDFAVAYVAAHTSRALPLVYKFTALWAGAAGSLLLWIWLQTGFVVLAFSSSAPDRAAFSAHARAAANLVGVFFLLVLIFDKDPFALSALTPDDGAGLNPLLQHPAMALHPPTLFVGYAAFIVPFAWAFASLKETRWSQSPLFVRARNWSLFAWVFLTIGIALGAWWAYEELGWGGYWAWDPVENSSLMPWLTATALLHCGRVYRSGGRIATWFVILALVTFSLCVFGTFLTRYGLVSSVHAFPEPGLGILFLVLLIHIWAFAGVLLVRRYLRREATESQSRVGPWAVILNNWLMVLLTVVILIGTIFPFLSGLVTDDKISLKSEYFTKITAPGGLILLLLLGICPHLIAHGFNRHWRTVGAVLVGGASIAIWAAAHRLALAYLMVCGFVGVNLLADFVRRYGRRRGAPSRSGRPGPGLRWLGARVVHIGVLMIFVGIAGSGGYDVEKRAALRPGESVELGEFRLTFKELEADHGANFTAVTANVAVAKGDKHVDDLSPSVAFYARSGKRTSEVDVRRTLAGDLYLAVTEVDTATNLINLTAYIKPLINWIWIGCVLLVVGSALVLVALATGTPRVSKGEDGE